MSRRFHRWVDDYQDQAWTLARYLLKDPSEAEDAVQDAYIKLWHNQDKIDPLKIKPEWCGCGELETNSDEDKYPDCVDQCDTDSNKKYPGECGCGEIDDEFGDPCNHDEDDDGILDWEDECPFDAEHDPIEDPCCHDEDEDGIDDWNDLCPLEPGFSRPRTIAPSTCRCYNGAAAHLAHPLIGHACSLTGRSRLERRE